MRYVLAIAIGFLVTVGLGYAVARYGQTADFSSFVPKNQIAAAEHLVDMVRERRFDEARAAVDPSIRNADPAVLEKMAGFFPKGEAFTVRVMNWQTQWHTQVNGPTTGRTLLQLCYVLKHGGAVVASVMFARDGESLSITAVNFLPVTEQQLHANDLDLRSMNGFQTLILLAAVLLDTFAIATFVICLMGPGPRWRVRWLWAILTLFGIFKLNAVWTTGATSFVLMAFMLPPAGMVQMPAGSPWVFGLSLPVGAVLYWIVRVSRGWNRRDEPEAVAPAMQF